MNPDLFANLGIGVASLWIIYIMLKYFMDSLTKKDIQLTTLVDNNNKTREFNFERLNSTSSCTELNIFYEHSLDFEEGFSDNANKVKLTDLFVSKVKELNCK